MNEALKEAVNKLADNCAEVLDKHVHTFLVITYYPNNTCKLRCFAGKSSWINWVYSPDGFPPKKDLHDMFFECMTTGHKEVLPKAYTSHMFESWHEFSNFMKMYGKERLMNEMEDN